MVEENISNIVLIQDIKGKIQSAYAKAPFDKGKEILETAGYKILSLEEMAKLRMQEGKDAYISQSGNWTREGILYVPKKGVFLTKNSPIINFAKRATECEKDHRFFTLFQPEEFLSDSIELKREEIPTTEFGNNPVTSYAFGNSAKDYGLFLKDAGISNMPIEVYSLDQFDEHEPFSRQVWFRQLGHEKKDLDDLLRLLCWDRSSIEGVGNGLADNWNVRGMQYKE